jgi:deoxyribose-phosphate aldolase
VANPESIPSDLAASVERLLWSPAATAGQIEQACAEARARKIRAVCVAGSRVELAAARLEDSAVKTVALVGFPLGTADTDAKRYEAEVAIDHGAQEIELLLNIGQLRDGNTRGVLRELRDVAEAADERPVCVALDLSFLTPEEARTACQLITDSGANAAAAGLGFWPGSPVTPEQVQLLRAALGAEFLLKVNGFAGDAASAQALIAAGANRLGVTVNAQ